MNIKQNILSLDLPNNSFVVVGSGILNVLGIRGSYDIDLIVSQEVFDSLDMAGWKRDVWPDQAVYKKGVFDIGIHWMGDRLDVLLKNATVIDGVPYLSLADLLQWKTRRARPKDISDIRLINDYLDKN